MRFVAACALLLATTPAFAEPDAAKPADDVVAARIARNAAEKFEKAVEADKAGKLRDAIRLYNDAFAVSKHPNTAYNLADVYRRLNDIHSAVRWYETYLQLAPDANDRADVEKILEKLHQVTGTVEIKTDEPEVYIFVDGKLQAGTPPLTRELLDGNHVVEAITPISYTHENCNVIAANKRDCTLHFRPRADGNVLLAGPAFGGLQGWEENHVRFSSWKRIQLAPGHYVLSRIKYNQCAPVSFDVPKGDDVTYVYFDAPAHKTLAHGECVPITATQQRLHFK